MSLTNTPFPFQSKTNIRNTHGNTLVLALALKIRNMYRFKQKRYDQKICQLNFIIVLYDIECSP
jgi:hypothetical protein